MIVFDMQVFFHPTDYTHINEYVGSKIDQSPSTIIAYMWLHRNLGRHRCFTFQYSFFGCLLHLGSTIGNKPLNNCRKILFDGFGPRLNSRVWFWFRRCAPFYCFVSLVLVFGVGHLFVFLSFGVQFGVFCFEHLRFSFKCHCFFKESNVFS